MSGPSEERRELARLRWDLNNSPGINAESVAIVSEEWLAWARHHIDETLPMLLDALAAAERERDAFRARLEPTDERVERVAQVLHDTERAYLLRLEAGSAAKIKTWGQASGWGRAPYLLMARAILAALARESEG